MGRTTQLLSRKSKPRSIVGVDIEAGSVAAAQVIANGSVEVAGFGVEPLAPGAFREGEVADPEALGEALKRLFAQGKLAKDVRVGVANQRVAVRSLTLPAFDQPGELETAIRFQAQDHIPMPLEHAVLDWQVVARRTGENGERMMDVVAVAARRDMLAPIVEAVRAAGLRPAGIDVAAFGMIRALAPAQAVRDDAAPAPTLLYCNLGDITNLAVARGAACLFTRVSPFGVEGIAQRLAERRKLSLEHAREWLTHVGLGRAPEEIEGDPEIIAAARESLAEGVARLADELRLSLDFYNAQEGSVPIEGVVACGPGTTIPGLCDAIQLELGMPITVARPPSATSTTPPRRGSPSPTGWRWRSRDAARQPRTPRGSPRRRARSRSHRAGRLRPARRARGCAGGGDARGHHQQPDQRPQGRDRGPEGPGGRGPGGGAAAERLRPVRLARAGARGDRLLARPQPLRLAARPARARDRDPARRHADRHPGLGLGQQRYRHLLLELDRRPLRLVEPGELRRRPLANAFGLGPQPRPGRAHRRRRLDLRRHRVDRAVRHHDRLRLGAAQPGDRRARGAAGPDAGRGRAVPVRRYAGGRHGGRRGMRRSDRTVLAALAAAAILGAFWLLVLSPKRDDAAKLGDQVDQLRASVQQEQQLAADARAAKRDFARNYHHLV